MLLAGVLVACTGGGPGGGGPGGQQGISGQVIAPAGETAAGTVVTLCVAGTDCTNNGWVADTVVNQSGGNFNFSFSNVSAGTYDVRGYRALNTFPVTYLEAVRTGVTAPTSSVVLPLSLQGAVPDAGTISGTIHSGGASSVAGTTVFVCNAGTDCSGGGQIASAVVNTDAPQGAFTLTGVPAGTYTLVAVQQAPFGNPAPNNRHFGRIDNVTSPTNGVQVTMDLQVAAPSDGTAVISGTIRYPGATGASVDGETAAESLVAEFMPAGTPEAEIVPGQLVVRFDSSALSTQADLSVMNVGGFTLLRVAEALPDGFHVFEAAGASDEDVLRISRQLRARPGVVSAAPNWILHSFRAPNDPFYSIQEWHYQALNLENAWDITTGSSNVTVAVVDSGGVEHPDLPPLKGYDFISDITSAGDGNGRDSDPTDRGDGSGYHGAHVAGTIGANSNDGVGVAGVNWNVNLIHVRALGKGGSGSFIDILDGIKWAAGGSVAGVDANPNPARVINLSLGADIGVSCRDAMGGDTSFFESLAAAGVILVVAAGNSNIDAVGTFPANCPGVITVGATGPDHSRAPYSNFGANIDVMGPGGDTGRYNQVGQEYYPAGVLSTILDGSGQPSIDFMQGTSMASPHIAGVVALMLANEPNLSFNQVLTRLKESTWHPSCGTAQCGAGLVDAHAALTGTGGGDAPPSVDPGTDEGVSTWIDFYRQTPTGLEWEGWVEFTDIELLVVDYMIWNIPADTYTVHAFQNLNGYEPDGFAYWDEGEPEAVVQNLQLPANTHVGNVDLTLQAALVIESTGDPLGIGLNR